MESLNTGEVISLITRTRRKVNEFLSAALKQNDLNIFISHGDILAYLYEHKRLPMKEMARLIHKDKSTVTALVTKLVKLGLVKKVNDDEDSRIVFIELTQKGKKLEPIFKKISTDLITRAYLNFSTEEKKQLNLLLKKMMNNF